MDVCHLSIQQKANTARHTSSTSLVKSIKLGSISALLRHNHSHGMAGLQFDIRAKAVKLSRKARESV